MVYAVQADLYYTTAARRDTVKASIESHFGTKATWGGPEKTRALGIVGKRTKPSLIVGVRFVSKADADAFYDNANTYFGTSTTGPQVGSVMKQHVCYHDDADPKPCVDSRVRRW